MPTTISGTDGVSAVVDGTIVAADIASGAVTQAKLGTNVASNGPAFRAYAGTTTTVGNFSWVKVIFNTEDFDTNSNFSASTFTPTVAGYYQINAGASYASPYASNAVLAIYKGPAGSTSNISQGFQIVGLTYRTSISDIVYCNGTTDTIEIWSSHVSGDNRTIEAQSGTTYFSGCLVRAA
jgi:hypothetical protein